MGKLSAILALGIVLTVSFIAFMPDGESEVLARLNQAGIFPQSKSIVYQDRLQIRAMIVGEASKPVLLLIHGSPGDWSAWEHIISNDSIRQVFQIVSIDRAGYGETTVPALKNLDDQADVVWSMMMELGQTQHITVVGHSYGGAIAEQLLIDHPKAFKKAVLVAPTLGPALMAPRWYNRVASWTLINKLVGNDLRSSNTEMMGLPTSLQLNENHLKQIETAIVYIQGMEDFLVPHETVAYFKEHKPTGVKYIIMEDMNHFTLWSDPHIITEAILGRHGNN